jgi:hypothetical protein
MTRFLFDLRSIFAKIRINSAVAQRSCQALDTMSAEGAADNASFGSGWFDSSWDLRTGLDVLESAAGDAALNRWLGVWAAASAVPQRNEKPGARLVPAASHGALGDSQKFADLGLGVAAEVAHLDEYSEFRIDGLELV